MNKKFLMLCIAAIFLIMSVSAIPAQNDDLQSIQVKATGDLPDQITVSLVCNGDVVDTASLNSDNSWKTTFKISGDENYQIVAKDNGDYSFSVNGNVYDGFVVNSKLVNSEVLGVSDDTLLGEDDDDINITNSTNGVNNNETINNETDDDSDDDSIDDMGDEIADDVSDGDAVGSTNQQKTDTPKKDVKDDKQPVKKENKTHQAKLKNTGLPIVVLVIVSIIVAFIPFNRKKR